MRYGIIPTRIVERVALWFGRVPVAIADSLLPLLQTRSLMAAVRLGVIDFMATNAVSRRTLQHRAASTQTPSKCSYVYSSLLDTCL